MIYIIIVFVIITTILVLHSIRLKEMEKKNEGFEIFLDDVIDTLNTIRENRQE